MMSEYEFFSGESFDEGYGQFDDGAMKCPPVSGVSGVFRECQRGSELLRLRNCHGDWGRDTELDRAIKCRARHPWIQS